MTQIHSLSLNGLAKDVLTKLIANISIIYLQVQEVYICKNQNKSKENGNDWLRKDIDSGVFRKVGRPHNHTL